jgi:hypothetical protein
MMGEIRSKHGGNEKMLKIITRNPKMEQTTRGT